MIDINKKILIVEDDQDFISILKIKFASEGFLVVTAENGEDGVTMAEKEKPDLIISDVLIPQMNGIEMAKKIKQANKNVPIIFLTNINLKDEDYAGDIKELGDFEHWVKADTRINDIVEKTKIKLGIK
jgi:two-component system OmpR family response regulator